MITSIMSMSINAHTFSCWSWCQWWWLLTIHILSFRWECQSWLINQFTKTWISDENQAFVASGHTAFSRQEGAAQARVLLVLAFLIGGWQGGLFSHWGLTRRTLFSSGIDKEDKMVWLALSLSTRRRTRWTWQGGHDLVIHAKENKINWTKSVVSFYKVANRNPPPSPNAMW